jgi:hypothetical protein
MKKLTIPCDVGGKQHPIDLYIGKPRAGHHPVQNQSSWLGKQRGISIPSNIMESLKRLEELSIKNKVSFEDLCVYAVNAANPPKEASDKAIPEEKKAQVEALEKASPAQTTDGIT